MLAQALFEIVQAVIDPLDIDVQPFGDLFIGKRLLLQFQDVAVLRVQGFEKGIL